MTPQVPDELVRLAHRMADAARTQTLPRFRSGLAVQDKRPGDFDPVTEADRAAEAAMRELLRAEAPEHSIIGEEHGRRDGGSPWTWVLDPIDGTRAFISGFPTWVTLIGLFHEGRPAFGLIDAPVPDDRFISHGASHRVRACNSLADAIVSTTSPDLFTGPDRVAWEAIRAGSRLVRYGGDGYAYGLLADGHLDAVVECGLQLYDVAALIPVVRAAGGRITGWDGGDALRGHVVAAGDPGVHTAILDILRESGATGAG